MKNNNSMKKIGVLSLMFMVIPLSSCYFFPSSGSTSDVIDNDDEITSISIKLNKSTNTALVGESINFSVSITPDNGSWYQGKYYSASCYEWFYEKDTNAPKRFDSYGGANISFSFKEMGEYVFWAKYCNHSSHSDTTNDLVSNRISISVDLPESEKVLYKYTVLADETISIYAGKLLEKETEIILPSEIDGHIVSTIAKNGFSGLKNIKSVRIPFGISKIDERAFSGCSALEYVVIPSSITSIGNYAFSDCSSKLYGFFETSNVSSIGGYSSYYYSFIKGFNHWAPSCKDYLINEDLVYAMNTNLTLSVAINKSNKESITIPEEIGGKAVKGILGYAFQNNHIYDIVMPNCIEYINKYAFQNCTALKEINFPSSLVTIGDYAFSGCTGIKTIKFPYGLDKIGERAFSGCSSLEYVIIPSSITSIGNYAFSDCSSKLYGFFETSNVSSIDGYSSYYYSFIKGFNHWASSCKDYLINEGLVYAVRTDNTLGVISYFGREQEVSIPSAVNNMSVKSIFSYAFLNSNITSITLPNTIESINANAFKGCTALSNITFSENCQTIGDYAFSGCTSIKTIKFPYGLDKIGERAFSGCSSLDYVVIPKSVTSIGNYAFSDCSSKLYGFFETSNVSSIGGYSSYSYSFIKGFYTYYTEISDIIIENDILFGLKKDNTYSLIKATKRVKEIAIPNEVNNKKVTSIASEAFYEDIVLEKITLNQDLVLINKNAFYGCSALVSIVIPSHVTTIGSNAFANCNNLTIYSMSSKAPSGWASDWNKSNRPVYWSGQWSYVNNEPTPNS